MSEFAVDKFRRIVVKVGSALLIGADGLVDRPWLSGLAEDIADLHQRDHEVPVSYTHLRAHETF